MKKKQDDRLYILMRTDMASLNPGKAVAQGSHAATKFLTDVHQLESLKAYHPRVKEWTGNRGFGTKICLGVVSARQLKSVIGKARDRGLAAGIVRDPSYPLSDGLVTHHLSIETCGYIFGSPDETKPVLTGLELMK